MAPSAVHAVCAFFGARNRDRQDSSDRDPASAGGVVTNVAAPLTTEVTALTETPSLTTGASLRINIDCNQITVMSLGLCRK